MLQLGYENGCNSVFAQFIRMHLQAKAVSKMANRNEEILESVSRDVTWQERWPEVEERSPAPEEMTPTVHYVWCGANRQFTFCHYLGVLSAVRILKPLKLLFHFTHSLPVLDQFMYNDWFQELNDTVPFLELHPLHVRHACGSNDMLQSISQLLSSEGGMYVGENVILAQPPPPSVADTAVWTAGVPDRSEGDVIRGIMLVKTSFRDVRVNVSDVRVPQDCESDTSPLW
ncbi:uncharacterized protein [Littorina saxatilis]|uniref:uncharacterized protein n=1 Tax=Littorina saxatilis TaxID=31220 RepID=UPI0038B67C19